MTVEEFNHIGEKLSTMPLPHENRTARKSEGFKYVKYRLMRPLLKMIYQAYQKKNPDAPWISPGSIYVLKQILDKNMVGFEFGSGRSTVFYAELLNHITAIEHFKPWFSKVETLLESKAIKNTSLKLIEANGDAPSQHLSSEMQLFISADDYPVKDEVFKNYINALDEFPNSHFDFIAVDGRARLSCVLKSIGKLKQGGFLLLDNSERKRYQPALTALKDWSKIFTTTGLTDTTIWMKP
jgi:hypothetical protein